MLTRSEFQHATGLTRKALRIYEEKRLLQPEANRNMQAFYAEHDVDLGILIRLLRKTGISLSQIHVLFDHNTQNDMSTEEQIKDKLQAIIGDAQEAIDRLEHYTQLREAAVHRVLHGGYWAWSHSAEVSKSSVADFVSEFARSLNDVQISSQDIAARYERECNESVHVTCFIELNDGRYTPSIPGKKIFVTQYNYFAIRAAGVCGQYDCFDECYEILQMERMKQSKNNCNAVKSLEIYHKYPIDCIHGKPFDAMILN